MTESLVDFSTTELSRHGGCVTRVSTCFNLVSSGRAYGPFRRLPTETLILCPFYSFFLSYINVLKLEHSLGVKDFIPLGLRELLY
jgi:hypothetical protein